MRRLNVSEAECEFDPDDPPGFRVAMLRPGPGFGAELSGASVYELPAGEILCPYHYEYGEEEWLLALSGAPSIRTPEGVEELSPGDLVFFPTGPDGAHQVRNDSDEPARVLMWSTIIVPTATAYPDSDKVGIWTGDKSEDVMVERSSNVDYFHGEA